MIIRKDDAKLKEIVARGDIMEGEYLPRVLEILSAVRTRGDEALLHYTQTFDRNPVADAAALEIPKSAMKAAYDSLDAGLRDALVAARARITAFHEKQLEKTWMSEGADGELLGQKITPLDRVGVYVPGGKAAYPSSVLMNVLPAKVAGVQEIVMVSPAMDGQTNPVVLAAAYIAGVDRAFAVGGAQAVAALAYGTATVPKVDKIVGPGNIYVALAKKMVFGAVDIDMIAGPSEILVICDETANPEWVAADMLSQSEHDELASSVAITTSAAHAESVQAELMRQVALLPKEKIARASIEKYAAIIVVDSIEEACEVSNDIAPEHLEMMIASPLEHMHRIRHAGAIFLGRFTPEAIGDYFAGPNHVLPTGASARFFSPLGTYDFIKRSSIIYYSEAALKRDAAHVMTLATHEDLVAHQRSVGVRVK